MTTSINVLLIEDNPADARLVKEELRAAHPHTNIQLENANRLESGLAYLAANRVDAVLLDLSLPDSAGLETVRRVVTYVPQTPVIVMTGFEDEATGLQALQAGAQDYLIKGQVDGRLLTRVIQYGIQRKQAEMQLADAREFTQRIVTSSPVAIFTYRLSGECLSVNTAASQMVGGTVEQLRSQNFHQIESWKKSGLYSLATRAINTRETVADDVHVITTFGRDAWYRAQFVIFRSGGEDLLLMMFSDITERKLTEKALQERQALLDKSQAISHLGSWELDLVNNRVTWSEEVHRIFGIEGKEFKGNYEAFLETVYPDDRSRVEASFSESLRKQSSTFEIEHRIIQQNSGEIRFVHIKSEHLRDASGQIVRSVGMVQDITDRRKAEETLREKEFLLSEAQRIGRIGSWIYDIAGDTMRFSDEMYHLLDVQPEEFHHRSEDFLALVYPSDRPMASTWLAALKEGTQKKDLGFRLFHKTGELCYLHCTGIVEYDLTGAPFRFVGTLQDVTERRAAEMQIDQQLKRLTALGEIDRAIISSVDQRYTLNVILSHMISQLGVDAADVLLFDSDRQVLTYATGQGFRTKMMEPAYVRFGESHAGRAAKERRMIRILDLRESRNDPEFNTFIQAEGFVSYVAMPLMVKGKVSGVLEVYQRSSLQPYPEWLDFFNALVGQASIAIESTSLIEHLQTTNQELVRSYEATIEGWTRAMDLRDRETAGHSQRVAGLTLELARAMGIEESRLAHIRRGALLHDLGKLGVPDQILFKPAMLTIEERALIEKHVEFGYELLAPIPYLKPALNIPYFHHEKWDGTGYPLGLKGEQIPLEARIFALVDVWDALMSERPHRPAWTRENALEYIRTQSGTHFDPRVVECFFEVLRTKT